MDLNMEMNGFDLISVYHTTYFNNIKPVNRKDNAAKASSFITKWMFSATTCIQLPQHPLHRIIPPRKRKMG